tara:strand:- start:2904 stop:3203 length:300 start_codon:yes stop_codon:yes gene_type:complete
MRGELSATNAYVRLGPISINKNRESDPETWYLTADIEVFADVPEEGDSALQSLHVDRFKMSDIDPAAATVATVYGGLKAWLVTNTAVTAVTQLSDITDA